MVNIKFAQPRKLKIHKLVGLDVVFAFTLYLAMRIRQIFTWGYVLLDWSVYRAGILKRIIVSRMFWGRGGLYRSAFHVSVTVITGMLLLSGIVARFGLGVTNGEALAVSYGNAGNLDLLQQGGSLNTVLAVDAENANYRVFTHLVLAGETLQAIADRYGVSKDTVKWANSKLLSPFNDNVTVGSTLTIPEINGVLHKVEAKDTLDSIAALTAGNRFDIIELNELIPPDYSLAGKEFIFVPNGRILPPPPPPPVPYIVRLPSGGTCIETGIPVQPLGSFPVGTFTDPLCSPQCQGYTWQRGYSSWHDGADLSKGGGCPIRAAAAGTVRYAGWKGYGSGYTIIIDHGNGVETQYLHGDGNIWVRPGDYVYKGQDIMYMGTTGNSTGVHLHLTLKYNGSTIDPAPYVPYLR